MNRAIAFVVLGLGLAGCQAAPSAPVAADAPARPAVVAGGPPAPGEPTYARCGGARSPAAVAAVAPASFQPGTAVGRSRCGRAPVAVVPAGD